MPEKHWIWLSHPLSVNTPAYGGGPGLEWRLERSMADGDTCNALWLGFSNHLGSHVDAPRHFIADGKTVADYPPEAWVFNCPRLIDLPVEPGELITSTHLPPTSSGDAEVDLLLIRTGFEGLRGTASYWQHNPGLAPDLAGELIERFPALKAIGLDVISITSFQHREQGRCAHREFLGRGLRLFEDLSLAVVSDERPLGAVFALPLRVDNADAGPCTIIGRLA